MLALATAGQEALPVCDVELRSADPSYTSLTLQQLALAGYDPAQLFFITGADAFADIATLYDFPAVLDHGHFAVVVPSWLPGEPASQRAARPCQPA